MSTTKATKQNACPITDANQYQGAGKEVFALRTKEIIDADGRQAAIEIALGRMI
ncbi:MAG TPA: hypothetical protein O0Y06_06485 [Methanocorpusculum sp.]|nr:hypothetical protein [Methanocorpusculum sp.]HJK80532.1 hypothetical protein [Methanocorpusculum sp.]